MAIILVAFLLLVSCRSRRETLSVVRTADTVSSLKASSLKQLERETVWETVTVRPDTNGVLQVVARDIIRFTDRAVEKVSDTAEHVIQAVTTEHKNETETKTAAPVERKTSPWAIIVPWVLFSALAIALAYYTAKQWTSRN